MKLETGEYGGWGATGTSGVSCAKHVDGAVGYVNETGTFYIIDTTKIPKNEKAWDMESTAYENGYKHREPGSKQDETGGKQDETGGEVNVSFIPRNAIVGGVYIDMSFNIGDKNNQARLDVIKRKRENFCFNPDYKQ